MLKNSNCAIFPFCPPSTLSSLIKVILYHSELSLPCRLSAQAVLRFFFLTNWTHITVITSWSQLLFQQDQSTLQRHIDNILTYQFRQVHSALPTLIPSETNATTLPTLSPAEQTPAAQTTATSLTEPSSSRSLRLRGPRRLFDHSLLL